MEQLKNVRSVDNLVDDINEHFQNISHKIKRLSKKNNLAYNVFLENQFIPIYNIGFSLEFEKCKRPREPAIDLIDNTKKIGLQVSSEATIGKLKKTFKQFYKNGKDEEIVRLKFFFLVQDGNKLNQVCVNDIVEYLNSEKILVEINSKRRNNKLEKIEIPISLFNPKEDILDFNFVEEKSYYYDTIKLEKILDLLNQTWPHLKYSIEEMENVVLSKQTKSLNEKLDRLSNNEAIKLITETFCPLQIIPYHILIRLNYLGKKIGYYVENFTLVTENTDLINNIKLELESNIQPTVNFLKRNKIFKVKELTNKGVSLKIDSFNNSVVSCAICLYEGMIFDHKILYDSPNIVINENNLEESFNKAYFFAEVGKYEAAVNQLVYIIDFCKGKFYIATFIATYNLKRLKESYYIKNLGESPFKNLSGEILKHIDRNFSVSFSDTIHLEEKMVIDYFYNFKHVINQYQIVSLTIDIDKSIYLDNNGKYTRNDLFIDWYLLIFNGINVTEHNRLLYDTKSDEVLQLMHISFLALLKLSQSRHEKTPKTLLWDGFIKNSIIVMNESDLKFCLNMYSNSSPIFSLENNLNVIYDIIIKMLTNLYDQRVILSNYFKSCEVNSFGFKDRINNVIENICVYITFLNFTSEQVNETLFKLMEIFKAEYLLKPSAFNQLVTLINKRQKEITIRNCDIANGLFSQFPALFTDLQLSSGNFVSLDNFDYKNCDIDTLFYLWFYRKIEVNKEELKQAFENHLQTNFNFEYLRLGVITDLVNFENYKDKSINYLDEIINDPYDFSLNEWIVKSFLEVAYHESINLSLPEYYKLLPTKSKEAEYYKWLFNLNSYDYSNFRPYWLLKYPYDIFLNKFREIPLVKEKLVEYLKENEDGKLSKIYFQYFLNN